MAYIITYYHHMDGFPTKPSGSQKHRSAARTLVVRQKQGPILLLHGAFPRRRVEKTCLEPSPNHLTFGGLVVYCPRSAG